MTGACGESRRVYVYDVTGELLGEYSVLVDGPGKLYPKQERLRASFAGRPLEWEDRLGSKVVGPIDQQTGQSARYRYYPYGQNIGTNVGWDDVQFATYTRDGATGLDYARNRYYARTWGRFLSPDPYVPSGGPADPGSWNRYAYVQGDPVNRTDPTGLYWWWADSLTYAEVSIGGGSLGGMWGCNMPGWMPGTFCALWMTLPVLGFALSEEKPDLCDLSGFDSDEDRKAAIAVVLGESSYPYIGSKAYSPGDAYGRPTGPLITTETVNVESHIMVSVLLNRLNNHLYGGGQTIREVVHIPNQFVGLTAGYGLIEQARASNSTSAICERVRFAESAVNEVIWNRGSYDYPFFSWKATAHDRRVRTPGPGEFWVARTAFQLK